MPDFSKKINTDVETTGFQSVVFGAKSALLEVELNEAQALINHKFNTLLKEMFGDCCSKSTSIVLEFPEDADIDMSTPYSLNGTIEKGSTFIVGGYIVTFSETAEFTIDARYKSAYLGVKLETVTGEDEVTYNGLDDGFTPMEITNTTVDERVGKETSRREYLKVFIKAQTSDFEEGVVYMPLYENKEFVAKEVSLNTIKDTLDSLSDIYAKKSIYGDDAVSLGRIGSVGNSSFAFGTNVTATGNYSHAEGQNTTASGVSSHAEGSYTLASSPFQHVQGKYNVEDTENKYAHIVGGGTSYSNPKNIHTIDWDGNSEYSGDVVADKDNTKVSLLNEHKRISDNGYGENAGGKNLADFAKLNSYAINGVTFTYQSDGSIRVKGTIRNDNGNTCTPYNLTKKKLTGGKWYTASCKSSNPDSLVKLFLIGKKSPTTTLQVTETTDVYYYLIFYKVDSPIPDRTVIDETLYPQIEEGQQATSYEPYFPSNLSLDRDVANIATFINNKKIINGKSVTITGGKDYTVYTFPFEIKDGLYMFSYCVETEDTVIWSSMLFEIISQKPLSSSEIIVGYTINSTSGVCSAKLVNGTSTLPTLTLKLSPPSSGSFKVTLYLTEIYAIRG